MPNCVQENCVQVIITAMATVKQNCCYVTVLGKLHLSSSLNIITIQSARYYPQFKDEKTEAQQLYKPEIELGEPRLAVSMLISSIYLWNLQRGPSISFIKPYPRIKGF